MSRSHASKRTVAQWVTWSKSEGYEGILETGPNEQVQGGKVYCNLCAIFFVADANAITRAFPANEIRIFTDDLGRARLDNASKDLPELRALFDSGRLRFQESTGYLDATIEAARCEFWFQRLGGGIQIIPLFSLMPFLMLSEDIHVLRLGGGSKGKFYSWHHRGQVWQQSVAASFIPASPKLERARLSETSFH